MSLAQGERLRDEGLAKTNCWPWDEPIARARSIGILLAKRHGTITVDEIRDYMENSPDSATRMAVQAIPAAGWGNIMRTPKLRHTGNYRKSTRTERHANPNAVWSYDDQKQ